MARDTVTKRIWSEEKLISDCRDMLSSYDSTIMDNFNMLSKYSELKRTDEGLLPIILIIEGASATGKSLLASSMISNLCVTRTVSTDSVRQVLRSLHSQDEIPELFCHTYQAYKHKQSGPDYLDPILRGFLAQCHHITPTVKQTLARIVAEGIRAVVEGVHLIPGDVLPENRGVVEVLVNPSPEIHKSMFTSKHLAGSLKSVTDDENIRDKEYEAALLIQEYMVEQAHECGVHTIDLQSYELAENEINDLVVQRVRELMKTT
jgi:2-phosphoglycerate kinase